MTNPGNHNPYSPQPPRSNGPGRSPYAPNQPVPQPQQSYQHPVQLPPPPQPFQGPQQFPPPQHQPYPQPAGQHGGSSGPGNGFFIGLAVIAMFTVVAIAAVLMLGDGSAGSPGAKAQRVSTDPQTFTGEIIEANFKDGQMVDCRFGDEFYDKTGIRDLDLTPDYTICMGWVDTADAEVLTTVTVLEILEDRTPDTATPLGGEGLDDWVIEPAPGALSSQCELRSTRSELTRVGLSALAPCEVLYPLATHLNNLVDYYREITEGQQAHYVDPAPWKDLSIAPEEYKDLHRDAEPIGAPITLPTQPSLNGGVLTLTDVDTRQTTMEAGGVEAEVDKLCATVELATEKFNSADAAETPVPKLAMRYPNGSVVNMELEQGDETVQDNTTVPLKYCAMVHKMTRDHDLLISTTDLRDGEEVGAWQLYMDVDFQIS